MQGHLAQGLSAAEAAQAALEGGSSPEAGATTTLTDSAEALQEALERYDEQAANAILDRTLSTFTTETVLTEIVTPALRSAR